MRNILVAACLLAIGPALAAEPAPPAFAKKPVVSRDGGKTKIEFAVDRETDIAVYVEDVDGKIIRHVVAGVLGNNPPAPLKPDSLSQSIEWDGRDDDGKPATGGPFRVRVALGLKAKWGGTAFADRDQGGPNNIESVWGLAAGPDGRVYVMAERNSGLITRHNAIHVFLRDGRYERTIRPFPPNLAPERVAATGAFVLPGRTLTPVLHDYRHTNFYPASDVGELTVAAEPNTRGQHMAVTPAGHLLIAVDGPNPKDQRLAAIDGDGGIPNPSYAGPALLTANSNWNRPFLAASGEGKCVYITGLCGAAVYRARLPERSPAEVFFGERAKPGSDEKHLDQPRGIALDGKGFLLVADQKNNRVVVLAEKDGSFAGSFPVPSPGWIGVNRKTGAVYVESGISRSQYDKSGPGEVCILKFSSWKQPKEISRSKLPRPAMRHASFVPTLTFALDASAEPPVLWAGRSAAVDPLLRCEDRGESFTEWTPAGIQSSAAARFPHVSSDPHRRTVAAVGDDGSLILVDDASGEQRKIRLGGVPGSYSGQWDYGATYRLGLGGRIFRMACGGFVQFGPDGKFLPFPATETHERLRGRLPVCPSGTNAWERSIGTDRQGNIYVMNRGQQYHGLHKVDKYSPDGKVLGTVLWSVSDGMLGPRVDAKGNLYIADAVKPLGTKWPEDFDGRLPRGSEGFYQHSYGSLIKFGPKGGAIWIGDGKGTWKPAYESSAEMAKTCPWLKDFPFPTTLGLDPSLSKEPVDVWQLGMKPQPTVQGALWRYFGVGEIINLLGGPCHCTYTDFDTDDFGRSFVMDQLRFRISVVDANGNVIRHIGAYGNQDSCGPESYVFDPKEKCYRPRKPDDPKDRLPKSPFAEPEIAFAWIVSAAVTDRHLYVADSINRRVLRVRLDYAASETISLP